MDGCSGGDAEGGTGNLQRRGGDGDEVLSGDAIELDWAGRGPLRHAVEEIDSDIVLEQRDDAERTGIYFDARHDVERDAEEIADDGAQRVTVAEDRNFLFGRFMTQTKDFANHASLHFMDVFAVGKMHERAVGVPLFPLGQRFEFFQQFAVVIAKVDFDDGVGRFDRGVDARGKRHGCFAAAFHRAANDALDTLGAKAISDALGLFAACGVQVDARRATSDGFADEIVRAVTHEVKGCHRKTICVGVAETSLKLDTSASEWSQTD